MTIKDHLIIIPARFKSSRFPGKPLAPINGKSMIERVWETCLKVTKKENIMVATDHQKIKKHCSDKNINVMMTSNKCLTGSDRLAEVSRQIKANFYVNVQGDEPLIKPNDIKKVIDYFKNNREECVCAMTEILNENEFYNLNIPKVIIDNNGYLLYFSRAPIPSSKIGGFNNALKQVCIYAFSPNSLKEFGLKKKKTKYESIEDIELLRLKEKGYRIKMIKVSSSSIAVDIPDDINKVLNQLNVS